MAKKQLFAQQQQLAFKMAALGEYSEDDLRKDLRMAKDSIILSYGEYKPIFPPPESIFDKKYLFKQYGGQAS
jgi:hypothetical protein